MALGAWLGACETFPIASFGSILRRNPWACRRPKAPKCIGPGTVLQSFSQNGRAPCVQLLPMSFKHSNFHAFDRLTDDSALKTFRSASEFPAGGLFHAPSAHGCLKTTIKVLTLTTHSASAGGTDAKNEGEKIKSESFPSGILGTTVTGSARRWPRGLKLSAKNVSLFPCNAPWKML